MGFSRQRYWSGISFPSPGDLPNPGMEPACLKSPALAGGLFYHWATKEAPVLHFIGRRKLQKKTPMFFWDRCFLFFFLIFLFSFFFLTCCLLPKSRPALCNPRDCSPPGSSIHGILQARIPEWVAVPSSRGSSWPRDQTHISYVSCSGRWVLLSEKPVLDMDHFQSLYWLQYCFSFSILAMRYIGF